MKRKLFKKTTERVAATKDVTACKTRRRPPVFNILLIILVWLAVVTLFYSGRILRPQPLVLGQQAPETIIASVDFRAETIASTELKKREASDKVLPVFTIDTSGLTRAGQMLSKLFIHLNTLKNPDTPEQRSTALGTINGLLDGSNIPLTADELLRIVPNGNVDMQKIIFDAVSAPVSQGIISESDLATHFNSLAPTGQVTVRGQEPETIRDLNSFITQSAALQTTLKTIIENLPKDNRDETVLRTLISPWLRPNVVYDPAETEARRSQAMDAVEPVIDPVEAGTILIRSGDTVSEQTLRWLSAHEKRMSELETPAERIQRLAGSGLLLLAGLLLTVAIAGIIQHDLLRNRRITLLLLILSLLPIIFGKVLLTITVNLQWMPTAVLNYILPLGLAPILASVLMGSIPGLLCGIWVSFALSVLLGGSFEVLVLGLLVTIISIYTTRNVKRRTTLFRAGLWVGAVKILFALIMAVLNQPSWIVLLPQLGTALLSGFTYALIVMLLIPLFEHLFKVTTDITLLELSDLSHPLLQSLAINAPGTYHHSLMMASLAQNAAEAIGANGLLLRVCAYFHDIGKLVKPGFFSENIQFTENPHDELSPSMSTLVIVSHIKEGVTLAKKHKLPQIIIDGIQQHQGTSLVSVFYHRAKTRQQETDSSASAINDEDFRYEGPRPQTREMAVLMLADSCEAASRSLDKPTPVRITNLIHDIFDSRLRDGQLDECDLTLAELHKIRESFIFTLTNMLHGRVAYPKDDEKNSNSEKPNTEGTPNN